MGLADRLRRLEWLAPPPTRRVVDLRLDDREAPRWREGERHGLLRWDEESGHWTPSNPQEFRELLHQRLARRSP